MEANVHDNWLYAHAVDHHHRRIVLHTVYPHVEPAEFTDLVFEGVSVHHFEQQLMSSGPAPAVVLFGVEEVDAKWLLEQYGELLDRTKGYGWPIHAYDDLDDLIKKLTARGEKCFEIHGTIGIEGFVFAARMEVRSRRSRAEPTRGV
ncbi:MAG TPA: hypothetical protein VGE52_08490 [Pirellulales bacterium]